MCIRLVLRSALPLSLVFLSVGPIAAEENTDATQVRFTDADRIAKLQQNIEDDQKHLDELEKKLNDPNSEYNLAGEAFKKFDAEMMALRQESTHLKDEEKLKEYAEAEGKITQLEPDWTAARDRFNKAIEQRKEIARAAELLKKSLERNNGELKALLGEAEQPKEADKPKAATEQPKEATEKPKQPSAPAQPGPLPAMPGLPSVPVNPGEAKPGEAEAKKDPPSQAYLKTEEQAKRKEQDAANAKEKAESLTKLIENLEEQIETDEKLLKGDRSLLEQATTDKERRELNERISRKSGQLVTLRTTLETLREQRRGNLDMADRKLKEAEDSRRELDRLADPFARENIMEWAALHLPPAGLIIVFMFLFRWLARRFSGRLIKVAAHKSRGRTTEEARANRIETLNGVFGSTSSLLILGGGTIMLLDELGVPVVPLLGGAAVIGLAVAFGAQNLIKDYFAGLMVLLEDQYGLHDVVRIGDVTGKVEKIRLRMTVLRDIEGVVHFIPHGQLTVVSNMSHGFSQAFLKIGVSYNEDVDEVMDVLMGVAQELRYDKDFGPLLLDDPEMLGVDRFGESEVVISFFVKTAPLKQWKVRRELMRRIKKKFDEEGIEIPFPHRTVYHRWQGEADAAHHGMPPLQSKDSRDVA